MKAINYIAFYLSILIFAFTYLVDPYKINDGEDIVIDNDTVAFLKLAYILVILLSSFSSYSFFKTYKSDRYKICSLIILVLGLTFLGKMFLYFDRFS